MIVFDLKCDAHGHVFEAWFGSSGDYESQRERGLIACPLCGDTAIGKAVMAPAVAAKGNRRPDPLPVPMPTSGRGPDQPAPVAVTGADAAKLRAIAQTLFEAQQQALKESTWVGRDFAEQARSMHYGEQDRASIHGEVAPEEARALIEEGVEVAPLPFPVVPPHAKN